MIWLQGWENLFFHPLVLSNIKELLKKKVKMKIKHVLKQEASINMTPMIDVVFLLLTFFMLTSTYIKTSAINVDLPSSQTSDVQPVREVVITLYKSGDITLNEKTIKIDAVGKAVRALYNENQDIVVTIRGDQGVAYGQLIEMMDTVRLAGVKRMSLATRLKK